MFLWSKSTKLDRTFHDRFYDCTCTETNSHEPKYARIMYVCSHFTTDYVVITGKRTTVYTVSIAKKADRTAYVRRAV